MSICKLTYFNSQALGESIRMLLHYGNIEFDDVRLDFEKDWPTYPKDSLPFGQVPKLEIDGKELYQSIAICRYLAKKVGLSGTTTMEDYEIDNAVDNVNDFRASELENIWDAWEQIIEFVFFFELPNIPGIASGHYEPNAVVKAEKIALIRSEAVPFFLDRLERIAAQNNGHFALQKFTWADVYFTGQINYLNAMVGFDMTENRPNLRKVVENTESAPGIRQWIEKRPKTIY